MELYLNSAIRLHDAVDNFYLLTLMINTLVICDFVIFPVSSKFDYANMKRLLSVIRVKLKKEMDSGLVSSVSIF
jgi:hypothetical protein